MTRLLWGSGKRRIGDVISYGKNMYDTVLDADAIFHVTEWKEFQYAQLGSDKEGNEGKPGTDRR